MAAAPQNINVRKLVVQKVSPHTPRRWKWFDHNTNLDTISTPTLMLTFQKWSRHQIAGHRIATFMLTIFEPQTQPGRADNQLDDEIIDLLNAIDQARELDENFPITWSTAERGIASNGRNPGFDISLTLVTRFTKE